MATTVTMIYIMRKKNSWCVSTDVPPIQNKRFKSVLNQISPKIIAQIGQVNTFAYFLVLLLLSLFLFLLLLFYCCDYDIGLKIKKHVVRTKFKLDTSSTNKRSQHIPKYG
jgi:hypothetical protein